MPPRPGQILRRMQDRGPMTREGAVQSSPQLPTRQTVGRRRGQMGDLRKRGGVRPSLPSFQNFSSAGGQPE